jgi:hypothetical protein
MNFGKTEATGPTRLLVPTAQNSRKAGLRILEFGVRFNNKLFCQENDMFANRFASHSTMLRSDYPLSDD